MRPVNRTDSDRCFAESASLKQWARSLALRGGECSCTVVPRAFGPKQASQALHFGGLASVKNQE